MSFGPEIINLTKVDFTPELLKSIPADVVRKYRVLPVEEQDDCLVIALVDATDLNTLDSLAHILNRELAIRVADSRQLERFVGYLYGD